MATLRDAINQDTAALRVKLDEFKAKVENTKAKMERVDATGKLFAAALDDDIAVAKQKMIDWFASHGA
tara:strand:+ start:1370 stop:1573 length:204 start_codon:yes stop_codon:yes gene_type:complete